jgi:type II secretory pathway pseudopilin PulG
MRRLPAFTVFELLACLAAVAVLVVLSLPAFSQTSRDNGLSVSLNNVRIIMEAQAAYRNDHGRVPMRGSRYTNGNLSGWESWNMGGKNCDSRSSFWSTYAGGIFDQSAYSRFLNPYIYPDVGIPRPPTYVNLGSGSTWTFHAGAPSAQQRAALELPVFRSPGDTETRQRLWPNPTAGLSSYDDVGTSYHVNMNWWNMPSLVPLQFTQRFNAGTGLIHAQAPDHYIWVSDQMGSVVPNVSGPIQIPGEFGGTNMSVVGFMDGRSEYIELLAATHQGPGYTLWPDTRSITQQQRR